MTNIRKIPYTVFIGPPMSRAELASQMALVVDDFNAAYRVWSDPETSAENSDFALRVMEACERERFVIRARVRAL